jgi:hypothetical protein
MVIAPAEKTSTERRDEIVAKENKDQRDFAVVDKFGNVLKAKSN